MYIDREIGEKGFLLWGEYIEDVIRWLPGGSG